MIDSLMAEILHLHVLRWALQLVKFKSNAIFVNRRYFCNENIPLQLDIQGFLGIIFSESFSKPG